MDVKGKVLLQLFNKSKLRNGTKAFLEPNFFLYLFLVKFKKLGFSAPLKLCPTLQPSSLSVVVLQPDERHVSRTVSVLEWYITDTEHSTSHSNEENTTLLLH